MPIYISEILEAFKLTGVVSKRVTKIIIKVIGKRIIMHSDAPSAKIYYSNMDDEVTTSSTLYTTPFSIYGTTYFKLIIMVS